MTPRLVVAAALRSSSLLTSPVHLETRGGQAPDRCNAPLASQLALTSGPGIVLRTLTGQGATLRLALFPGGLNAVEFTFVTKSPARVYAGPIHVFRHGSSEHLCRSGTVMVNARGNTAQQANPFRVAFRFDGWIEGSKAWGDAWVKGVHYRVTTGTGNH